LAISPFVLLSIKFADFVALLFMPESASVQWEGCVSIAVPSTAEGS
jgi:hypothetical protein